MIQFDVVLIPDGESAQKARRCEALEARFAAEIVAGISHYESPFDSADAEVTDCETGERTHYNIIVIQQPVFEAEPYEPDQEKGGE